MKRVYYQQLLTYLELFPCVVIIGARQCGKTTLLNMLPEKWQIFDLERTSDYELISQDTDLFFRANNNCIAIDEAQILPQLFNSLRVAIDDDRQTPGRFIITGSSSPALTKAVSESLAGRVAIIEMSPLSFHEVTNFKTPNLYQFIYENNKPNELIHNLKEKGDIQLVYKYWLQGGYPELWIKDNKKFNKLWADNYISTYVERDLKQLFPKIDSHRYKSFISTLAQLSGSIINYSEISRALNVSQPTIKDYLDIADGTFLWRKIPSFKKKSLKRIVKHPKGYIRDSFLINHLLHIYDINLLLTHPNRGNMWEGIVIEEIIRGFKQLGASFDYYYYRTSAGAEVDLVLEGEFGLIPIEIKLGQTVTNNQLKSIRGFMEERGCAFGIVVNNDNRPKDYGDNLYGIPFNFL